MTETITVKKKKKIDFELLRKLEDEYDEAVEDLENKEKRLIEKVHEDYLKAYRKGDFFKELNHSEDWYYKKFKEYNFSIAQIEKSEGIQQAHQEKKKQQIMDDLDEMEKEVKEIPYVEVDETLIEESEYVNPREEQLDWIEKTKSKLAETESKEIVQESNFGTYQNTKNSIERMRHLYPIDFKVSDNYKKLLIHQLKKSIEYLKNLLEELE